MANGKGGYKMIELRHNVLNFFFPEVHSDARLQLEFQRTFRIPDDDKDYPLPPGLGKFPLQHVDDFDEGIPPPWIEHGGVMLPMYQSEALWINFSANYVESRRVYYPFAIKVSAGKINAITGDSWSEGLNKGPQDYLVAPEQPWLDGYCVEKGFIRQFVAMPLGAGYTAEEQLTGESQYGGIQIAVYPMKRKIFEKRFPRRKAPRVFHEIAGPSVCESFMDMGLAPGGRMRQEIYDDPFGITDWDQKVTSRCFVHIANSLIWRQITGDDPPTVPPTAKEYNQAGLPWFEYYNEIAVSVDGSKKLSKLKNVAKMGKEKGDVPLPENKSLNPKNIVKLHEGLKKDQVREGIF
jgi:hypothetical protein